MTIRPHFLLVALLGCLAQASHADTLNQTTITMVANGKPIGGLIFPIGTKVEPSLVANSTDTNATETSYKGNVPGRFTPPAGQSIVFFGEQVVVSHHAISPVRAQAVHDLENMNASDQLYRGRSVTGNLTPQPSQTAFLVLQHADQAVKERPARFRADRGWKTCRRGPAQHRPRAACRVCEKRWIDVFAKAKNWRDKREMIGRA